MRKTMSLAVLGTLLAVACSPPGSGSASEETGDPELTEDPGAEEIWEEEEAWDEGPVAANLAIEAVTFRQVGRRGEDMLVEITGTDSLANTSAALLRFLDASGNPVPDAVDTNWDGEPDAPEKRFHFETSTVGQTSFTGTVLVRGAFTASTHGVAVALEDETGGRSKVAKADIAVQALREANEECDPAKLVDRCPAGMACKGTPATCQPGSAPQLAKVVYVGGASGRMMFKGIDEDEDVDGLSIEFLDASNNPVLVSWFEDGPTSSSIDLKLARPDGPGFVVDTIPSAEFAGQVAKIAATATDAMGATSTRVVSARGSLPVRGGGQSCDPDGLDTCGNGFLCTPGIASADNKCTSASTYRTKKCNAAAALDPAKGRVRAFGKVEGASAWEPPDGCVPALATKRPDVAIPLELSAPAAKLVVTTALPETDFDTVVYLLEGCAAPTSDADKEKAKGRCNDDAEGFASTFTATDVPAGKYTIVVDSISTRGGHFGVEVRVE